MVGVIAVPTEAAQQVADELVDAGVKIIFNYSEALLQVPPEVTVHTSSPGRGPALRALLLPDLSLDMLDMARAREVFEASEDFTVGLEEEFGILDPDTRALAQRFEELRDAAQADEVLAESVAGELIESEIEIRSGRGETFADAAARQREARARLFALAADRGALLSATGTHPWSPWQEQRIIDTEHYHRVEDGLKYVAWRNNTFSLHVHVGIRGADRAIAVCDRLRPILPGAARAVGQLALPRRPRLGPALRAHADLHEELPPLRDPGPVRRASTTYADYVDFLVRTNSIVEHTQLWWSVRPHHSFGTVELRICDAQSSAEDSTALAGHDHGLRRSGRDRPRRRRGLRGPSAAAHRGELLARDPLRVGRQDDRPRARRGVPRRRGAPTGCWPGPRPPARRWAWTWRCRARTAPSASAAPWRRERRCEEVFAAEVAETQRTYAGAEVRS